LVLLNGYRVNEDNCPEILDKWDKIYFDEIMPFPEETLRFQKEVRTPVYNQLQQLGIESNINGTSSEWIGMNVLSLDQDTVVVDKRQTRLITALEKHGLTVVPISFRHSYYMGGIHCSTLDTVRDSKLESYFD
jgi:arginine deiminase